jgi:hypothetical protein
VVCSIGPGTMSSIGLKSTSGASMNSQSSTDMAGSIESLPCALGSYTSVVLRLRTRALSNI